MRRDQGLEHFGEALGGAARPEALNRDPGALDQQEQFIGQKLGIPQPRLATELADQVANSALAALDHAPGRVIRVRQFDRCVDKGAAALTRVELEFGNEALTGEQLVLWLAGMCSFDFGPGLFELSAVFAQTLGDQLVL